MNHLNLAYNITKEDINFLYNLCSFVLFEMDKDLELTFEIEDIMVIEAFYKYINNKDTVYIEEDEEYKYYYYTTQPLENIPIFEPKNGNIPFCEF